MKRKAGASRLSCKRKARLVSLIYVDSNRNRPNTANREQLMRDIHFAFLAVKLKAEATTVSENEVERIMPLVI